MKVRASIAKAAFALCIAAAPAAAQQFPTKPVRMIVPVSAGGLKDVVVRGIGQELSRMWGQPVVVENRLGAAHIVATEHVAKSAADGYTILATDKPWTANPFLYAKLPYDGVKALVGVVNFMQVTEILVSSTQLPASNLKEILAYAKANPGRINYGSFGKGSVTHVDAEALATAAGVRFTHIPYKGVADVIPALVSGDIQIAFAGVPPVLPMIKQGRIRAVAYGAAQRSPVLPDVPTFNEAGFPFEAWSWSGLMVPAGTPRPVIDKVAADIQRVLAIPEIRAKYYDNVGMEQNFMGPDRFAAFLQEDRTAFAQLVKVIGLKPE
jgi:tripartite-type tricarboxylate transporter receptor subunit TctC